MNATGHVMKIECPFAHRHSSSPQGNIAQMDRRSGEFEILVADPAWALANVGKPAKQRAPQSGRTAEPEIAAAGRERRRADQPLAEKIPWRVTPKKAARAVG